MSISAEQVLLKTPLNPLSGYGKDGMALASHLQNAGADVYLEPRSVGVPLTPEVADLLTKDYPRHFDVAIQHDYPGGLDLPQRLHKYCPKLIAWTMFEFLGFGNDPDQTTRLAERLEPFDALLAYDEVTKAAFLEYYPAEKIHILQGGYEADFWRLKDEEVTYRDWAADTFVFVMNGTCNARKNPFAAINAFNLLKAEHGDKFNASLKLKTTNRVLHPAMMEAYPGLEIFYEHWSERQVKSFYLNAHCLLAPSWGEGKNLPALEAQTTGMPVIVSDFGGHKQWADPEWAYLVGGTLAEHSPGMASIRVDEQELAETMWHVYSNRSEAQLKGQKASQVIPAMCDWSIVVEKLKYLVDELPAHI